MSKSYTYTNTYILTATWGYAVRRIAYCFCIFDDASTHAVRCCPSQSARLPVMVRQARVPTSTPGKSKYLLRATLVPRRKDPQEGHACSSLSFPSEGFISCTYSMT